MSNDIIKIDVKSIKDIYDLIKKEDVPEVLFRKRDELHNKYNCFHTSYVPEHFEVKRYGKFTKKKEYVHQNTSHPKLHIIPVDFTEENKVKKVYIGYLNKLTDANREAIMKKVADVLKRFEGDDTMTMLLYGIVWDFIKKSQMKIYEDILGLFDSQLTDRHIADYVENKRWYPSQELLNTNMTSTDKDVYDIYCHYVKWKKEVTNTIVSVCNLIKDKTALDVLMGDLHELMQSFENRYSTHKHMTDFALEQTFNILKKHYKKEAVKRISEKPQDEYESYTKFLVLNIVEL